MVRTFIVSPSTRMMPVLVRSARTGSVHEKSMRSLVVAPENVYDSTRSSGVKNRYTTRLSAMAVHSEQYTRPSIS